MVRLLLEEAAKVYGLEVLQDHVNDLKNNTTRFIVFSKELEYTPSSTCISVMFVLTHEAGTLCQIIQIINNHQINMLRIESRPLKETPWQYYFYVDFEGNLQDQNIIQAIDEMKAYTKMLKRGYLEIMKRKNNIVLIGMMGCGKTTIAHILGEELNKPVVDIDDYLVNSTI